VTRIATMKKNQDDEQTDCASLKARPLRGHLRASVPMATHTSWRAGGHAAQAYMPADLDDLCTFLATLDTGVAVCFVGLGSNLLVRDAGFRGCVIFTHGALKQTRADTLGFHAEAGVPSPKVARQAAMRGLSGAEFLAGIPGTVGGALAMNAGCYGTETWDIVEAVTTVDRAGRLHTRTRADYEIGYRTVIYRGENDPASVIAPDEWFVGARFALKRGETAESRATITELLERRLATQPLSEPNAGSVFRNPPGDFAARLIEACGLRGATIGGAAISVKHANFIVNNGEARAADIEALIETAREAVRRRFGIDLQQEVRIIGDRA
jgi:UDP-N-acetylmuramate dehydrogenase